MAPPASGVADVRAISAETVTGSGSGILAGAVYFPALVIMPIVVLPPVTPLTFQVVLPVAPVTENCVALLGWTTARGGLTLTDGWLLSGVKPGGEGCGGMLASTLAVPNSDVM